MSKFNIINILFSITLLGIVLLYVLDLIPLLAVVSVILLYLTAVILGILNIDYYLFIDSVITVDTEEKAVYFTFDDGPSSSHTNAILEKLNDHAVNATFFVIGDNIPGNEAVLKKVSDMGHAIGNHSNEHSTRLTYTSQSEIELDLKKNEDRIENVIGKKVRLYRPPYGITNPNIAKAIQTLNLKSIGWSVRSFDTFYKNPKQIVKRMLRTIQPGSILLFHDHQDVTIEVIDLLISELKSRNYTFNTLEDVLD